MKWPELRRITLSIIYFFLGIGNGSSNSTKISSARSQFANSGCPLSGGGCWVIITYGHEQEKFADTKEVIRSRNSKKDRQHNGQKKKDRQHNGQTKRDRQHNGQKKGHTTQQPKEKGQTTQWPKEKGQTTQWPNEKGQTTINKSLHRKLKIE